jgi:hypothetical protein
MFSASRAFRTENGGFGRGCLAGVRIHAGVVLMAVFVCLSWQLPLGAQSAENPGYIVFRTITTDSKMDRFADIYMDRLKDYGVQGRVYVDGQHRLILAGPFTSRAEFDSAMSKINAHDWAENSDPYYISEPPPPCSGGNCNTPGPGVPPQQQAPAGPTAQGIVEGIDQFFKERGGIFQAVEVSPYGPKDVGHLFDFKPTYLLFNWGEYASALGSSSSAIKWSEVRSVNVLPNGWIDIWAPLYTVDVASQSAHEAWNASDSARETYVVHLQFTLVNPNPQDSMLLANAIRQLVAANHSGSSN